MPIFPYFNRNIRSRTLKNSKTINRKFIKAIIIGGGGGGGSISISSTAWKNSNALTSVTCTVSPTTGNTLVAVITGYVASIANHSVTDNLGGTWTQLAGTDDTFQSSTSIWVRFGIPSGITSVTATLGAGAGTSQVIVHEVIGVTAWTSGEASVNNVATNTSAATPSLTNATAASIYFAVLDVETPSGTALATVNYTGSTGGTWALADSTNSQELDANNNIPISVPYLIVSTSASRIHVWNTDGSQAKTLIVCFH